MNIETIKIKADNKQGFIIINKDDFDDKSQELYTGVKATSKRTVKRTVKK